MKIVTVLMALVMSFVFGFSNVSDVYAVSAANDGVTQKTVENKSAAVAKKKGKKKSEKSMPHNIDINMAGKDQLMQLPGVGPKTADAILKYRKGSGKFKSIDELTNVKGIGDKTLAKLKPFLKKV